MTMDTDEPIGRGEPMDDETLLAALRAAEADAQDVPSWALDSGDAAYTWREVRTEMELMALVYDSALATPAGVRATAAQAPRMLVFESADVTIEIEISAETIIGYAVPGRPGRVRLEDRDSRTFDAESDDGGFFLLPHPAVSPVRLRWVGEDAHLMTDWFPV